MNVVSLTHTLLGAVATKCSAIYPVYAPTYLRVSHDNKLPRHLRVNVVFPNQALNTLSANHVALHPEILMDTS